MNRRMTLKTALALILLCGTQWRAAGRTIVLDASDWDQAAFIMENEPLSSWGSINHFHMTPRQALLVRYSLDQIPPGMHITNAEWIVPIYDGIDVRFYIWRILQDWGPGVCWQYRAMLPEKAAWAEPGARALGTDRFVSPTASCRAQGTDRSNYGSDAGLVVNVTKDVALWYTGAAGNYGWIITAEDHISLHSPFGRGTNMWKLRITFEPE
ncbi:MAG TPA: hypothetical protein VM186_14760 [Planctomycetota bacterium]|nr:hypothetical protein [Planctomycetota bacterium]